MMQMACQLAGESKEYGVAVLSLMLEKLGVAVRQVDRELAEKLALQEGGGLFVAWTKAGRAAENAGILWGDIILEVNYTLLHTLGDFERALATHDAGKPLRLLLQRAGTLRYVEFWLV